MTSPVLTQSFFLSAGETNAEQELSLPLLTAKIIDIATAHANALGVGNPAMADLGAGWVLARLTMEMFEYPHVNDTYQLSTWVETWNRHFSERCFSVECNGRTMGYARSVWMVMGTDSHRNIGLSHLTPPGNMIYDRPCPIARQARHRNIVPPECKPDAQDLVATAPLTQYTFRYCDLDAYRHVNTVRYVSLLLNQYTLDDFDRTAVERMELSFLHEARYGTAVNVLRADSEADPLLSSFLLREPQGGEEHLYARIRRRRR